MFPMPPTPPQTQPTLAPMVTDTLGPESMSMDGAKRHERFYETGGSLLDPVILRVTY